MAEDYKAISERMLAVLRRLEWSDNGCCPECGARNEDTWDSDLKKPVPHPHDPNCEIGKLLKGE